MSTEEPAGTPQSGPRKDSRAVPEGVSPEGSGPGEPGGPGGPGPSRGGPVLVTGGTGTLGRAVVRRLLDGGHTVRVLSRRPRPGPAENASGPAPDWATGDLVTGEGLGTAVAGATSVVHCATTGSRKDVRGTERLAEALRRSGGTPHLVYISIVGVDRVPFFYYRAKLDCERVVETSGLPWTVLRATQFHDLIALVTTAQRRLPFTLFFSGFSFQPVDVGEVADRLVELTTAPPAGRAQDMGGPEVRTSRELAQLTLHAYGRRRILLPVPLAGKAARAYKAGHHLTPGHAVGRRTYAEYLVDAAGAARRGHES